MGGTEWGRWLMTGYLGTGDIVPFGLQGEVCLIVCMFMCLLRIDVFLVLFLKGEKKLGIGKVD